MHSKRSLVVFATGLSLVLAGVILQAGSAKAQNRIRIALLPIVVHSAENPDYVRRGLADMLAARLERIPDLEVLRIDKTKAATTRLEKALRSATEATPRSRISAEVASASSRERE